MNKMNSQFYNSNKHKEELLLIMEDEADVVAFFNLLEKVRNISGCSADNRQAILSDLVFWKSQMTTMQKQIEDRLQKINAVAYKAVYDKLKLAGKPTDAQIKAEIDAQEKDAHYSNLKNMLEVAEKYSTVLNDLYFITGATHKIFGRDMC